VDISIVVLDSDPGVLDCLYLIDYICAQNSDINLKWYIPNYIYEPGGRSIITGYFFSPDKQILSRPTVKEIYSESYLAERDRSENTIYISSTRNSEITNNNYLVINEVFGSTETGLRMIPKTYNLDQTVLNEWLTGVFSSINSKLADILSKEGGMKAIANRKTLKELKVDPSLLMRTVLKDPKRGTIYIISSDGMGATIPGTGIYHLFKRFYKSIYNVAKKQNKNIVLCMESDILKLTITKEDAVFGITINGFYSGGYTSPWQGFRVGSLKALNGKCIEASILPVIVSSAHYGEFSLYGLLSEPDKKIIGNILYCGFHSKVNESLLLKGIGDLDTPVCPIPMEIPSKVFAKRLATNKKRILLQFDAQARKNGELSLAAVIDAFVIAKRTRPDLELIITAKSSAAFGYETAAYLHNLITTMGAHKIKGLIINQENIKTGSWEDVSQNIDILVALSTDEGLHYFIPEMWSLGVHCVIPENGPYSTYETLPDCNS